MRPYFLPDGSLLLGQTGRGWGARGGSVAALQRVIYDGKTVPADIMDVSAAKDGYTIRFTRPIAEGVTQEDINTRVAVESWFYTNLSDYGSPEHDKRNESIAAVKISDDRLSLHVQITGFGQEENWLDRIYHLQINSAPSIFGETPTPKNLEAYYTLRAIPQDH
jgi:hypothetical protein